MLKKIKAVFMTLFLIWGLVTFPLFIFEESQQVVMFGTWQAIDAGDWKTVYKGYRIGEKTNSAMKFVNNWFGWIQPLAFWSYDAYGEASDYYWMSLKANVLKNKPELMQGDRFEKTLKPERFIFKDGQAIAVAAGGIHFKVEKAEVKNYKVSGTIQLSDNNKVYIR